MKVFIMTLGCKVNQYESEAMLELFLNCDFERADNLEQSDVVIVNSCTVTSMSDRKTRHLINKIRKNNKDAIIVLTGCMPQAFPEISDRLENVDIVLGNSERSNIVSYVMEFISTRKKIIKIKPHKKDDKFENISINTFSQRTRAFMKIEDGCNRFCSYCIIPYARGKVRSKSIEDINNEAVNLSNSGYREIVLVGINLSAFGEDTGMHLCDAVESVCKVPGIERVRLGSLEPEQMEYDVLKRLSLQEKLCPQFHISLQSGCDATLKRMNRHYNSEEYQKITEDIRNIFKNPAITTDVMVGFPGETDHDFDESVKFVEKIKFSKVHVFTYSRRPGTRADLFKEHVGENIKSIRSKRMIETTNTSRRDFLCSQIGRVEPVLFEKFKNKDYLEGYTPNYTPVIMEKKVVIPGQIVNVLIDSVENDLCKGKLVGETRI